MKLAREQLVRRFINRTVLYGAIFLVPFTAFYLMGEGPFPSATEAALLVVAMALGMGLVIGTCILVIEAIFGEFRRPGDGIHDGYDGPPQ